jgi:hypothetical protein
MQGPEEVMMGFQATKIKIRHAYKKRRFFLPKKGIFSLNTL